MHDAIPSRILNGWLRLEKDLFHLQVLSYLPPTNYELSLSVYHGFRTQKTRGRVCAYTSPANFMPQLIRVSYIRRVRARLSCGV